MSAVLEKINELPEGWEERDLEDVLEVIRGISFKSNEKLKEPGKNTVVCLRTANVQENVDWGDLWWVPEDFVKREEQFIRENDILMSNANSYELVGKVSLVRAVHEKATLGAFITMLRAREGSDPKFFFYQLRSHRVVKEIRSRASTTTNISNVSTGKLKDLPLWVAPSEQQKRIVAKIEELFSHIDAGIEALKKAKQLLKQYRQSILKAAVTGELTKEWREVNKDKLEPASELLERILKERRQKWEEFESEKHRITNKIPKNVNWKKRYKEPLDFDFDDDIELPTEWAQVSLDTVTDLLTDYHANGSYKVLKEYVVLQDEPSYSIYIRSKNFEKEDFVNDLKYVSEEAYLKLWKSKLYGGELVVGKIGNAGRVYFMPKPTMPTTLGMNLFMLRLNKYVNNKYIYYVLKSGLGSLQISRRVKGVGNPTIDKVSLKNICIPLPCRKEQDLLVELIEDNLDKINRLEKDIDSQFLNVEKSKQSILASAFSGKV